MASQRLGYIASRLDVIESWESAGLSQYHEIVDTEKGAHGKEYHS
jgi:hypothetical protein